MSLDSDDENAALTSGDKCCWGVACRLVVYGAQSVSDQHTRWSALLCFRQCKRSAVCISEVEVGRRRPASLLCAADVELPLLLLLQLTRLASRRAYTSGSSVIDHVLSAEPPWIIARWKRFRPIQPQRVDTALYQTPTAVSACTN